MQKNKKGNGALGTKPLFLLGMLAVSLSFVLALGGCNDGNRNDNNREPTVTGEP